MIDRIADRWLGLAEKGREIERLSTTASQGTVTLRDLFASTRVTVEEDCPDAVVAVDFDGVDPELPVSERWYPAIVELCENGVKHAAGDGSTAAGDAGAARSAADSVRTGGGSPESTSSTTASVTVTVTSGSRPGWLVIAVADEGPGIPPDERTTLEGDTETPLRHGSGLGTWLVRFVVEQFGGWAGVEDREAGGSVVELHLPVPDEERATQRT